MELRLQKEVMGGWHIKADHRVNYSYASTPIIQHIVVALCFFTSQMHSSNNLEKRDRDSTWFISFDSKTVLGKSIRSPWTCKEQRDKHASTWKMGQRTEWKIHLAKLQKSELSHWENRQHIQQMTNACACEQGSIDTLEIKWVNGARQSEEHRYRYTEKSMLNCRKKLKMVKEYTKITFKIQR